MSDNFRTGNSSELGDQNTSAALLNDASSPRARQWEEASRASLHQPLKMNADGSYTVKDGDCLSTIAERELHMAGRKASRAAIADEVAHLKELNQAAHPRLANCDGIQEGWHLRLGLGHGHGSPQRRDCAPVEHHQMPERHPIPERHSMPERYSEPRYRRQPVQDGDQAGGIAQGILAPLAGLFSGIAGGFSHRHYGGGYMHRQPGFFGGFQQPYDYSYGNSNMAFPFQRNDRYYPQNYSSYGNGYDNGYGNGYDDYAPRPSYRPLPPSRYGRSSDWYGSRF